MPRCGRIVPELENPELREVIYGNYRIVCRIVGANDDIEILAVVHGARDPSASTELAMTGGWRAGGKGKNKNKSV